MTSYVMCNKKKLGIKKSDIECLKKSVEDRKLEYFKSELLKILDKKEKEESGEEVSKAFIVQELYKSMTDPLYMAKGGKVGAVGEIRTWNGKKYKKMPNKKWVRIYDKETRGAKLSIAALRRKVDACTNSQELLNLVLENRDRFCDELGRPLPIVQELSKYVSKKNDELEALPTGRNQKEHYADQKALKRRNAEAYNKKPVTSGEVKDNSNHATLTKDKSRRPQASKDNIAQDYNDVNKKIKIDIKDFPEQFNKGKWKKQTKILMDFMNSQNGDSVVKSLYKKLSVLKNDLPFKIAKAEKKFANGSFSVVCDRATMKPEEQRIHIKDITDESEDLKKSSCMEALHEIMHMIDFSCRDNKNSPDYASNSNRQLVNAINNAKVSDEEIKSLEGHFADYRAKERVIIDKLNAKAREIRELGKQYDSGAITTYSEYGEKYKAIQKEYEAEQKKLNELRAKKVEVSQYTDILDALSGGKLHDDKGFGGHGETYYRKESNKANEIVANYASLLAVGSEYADRLKKNYPELADSVYNLYRQFLER